MRDGTIPAVVAGPVTEEQDPVLLWVWTGAAVVEAAGVSHHLGAGDAIWMPPGIRHLTRTEAGSVVFPLFPLYPAPRGDLPESLSRVRRLVVPPGWAEWLVYQFHSDWLHEQEVDSGAGTLLALVAELAAQSPEGPSEAVASLRMPRSAAAHQVAETVLRSPTTLRSATASAEAAHVSLRTLQRQFRQETGLSLSQWQTRARVVAAARLLGDGGRVGRAGQQVGFATASGFTKAFRRHVGLSPRDYARARRRPGTPGHATHPGDDATSASTSPPPQPPAIGARTVWSRIKDRHVLLWVFRGRVRLQVGGRHWLLDTGQAMWVPAGFTQSASYEAGSILKLLGERASHERLGVEDLRVFTFRPDDTDFLLHTMLVEYTLFQPVAPRASFVEELFRVQVELSSARSAAGLSGAVAHIAGAVHRQPADQRSLADWALRLHTSATALGQEFVDQTGLPFPRWRAQLRMYLARDLLLLGEAPGEVARHLGYADPSSFSRAFTAAHGMSPRRFQRHHLRPRASPPTAPTDQAATDQDARGADPGSVPAPSAGPPAARRATTRSMTTPTEKPTTIPITIARTGRSLSPKPATPPIATVKAAQSEQATTASGSHLR